jgi:glycosyltransferase involved in cell wall biosynthesis
VRVAVDATAVPARLTGAGVYAARLLAALAEALAGALDDPGGEPATAARRAHAATFTWAACAEATLSAYRLALEAAR